MFFSALLSLVCNFGCCRPSWPIDRDPPLRRRLSFSFTVFLSFFFFGTLVGLSFCSSFCFHTQVLSGALKNTAPCLPACLPACLPECLPLSRSASSLGPCWNSEILLILNSKTDDFALRRGAFGCAHVARAPVWRSFPRIPPGGGGSSGNGVGCFAAV